MASKILKSTSNLPFRPAEITMVAGKFDLLHVGHMKFLEGCKKLGNPVLVVAWSDVLCRQTNPDRPVHNQKDRAFMLSALESVSWVYICKKSLDYNNGYLYKKFSPKVVVFSTGEIPIKIKRNEEKLLLTKFPSISIVHIPRQRFDVSTTQIIEKIKFNAN